jgi:FkbM family methyltransferase
MDDLAAIPKDLFTWETAREEDIYYCYRLLLNREPDPEGLKNHACAIKSGTTVRTLVSTFLNSPEFLKARMAEEAAREKPSLVDVDRFHISLCDLDSPVALGIVQTREYEPHLTSALEKILKAGMVFVDVGANVGFLSLLAARLVGARGKVHAFEPNQYFCKLLQLSAEKNGFENIEIYPMAIADGRKSVLYYNGRGNGVSAWRITSADLRRGLASTSLPGPERPVERY